MKLSVLSFFFSFKMESNYFLEVLTPHQFNISCYFTMFWMLKLNSSLFYCMLFSVLKCLFSYRLFSSSFSFVLEQLNDKMLFILTSTAASVAASVICKVSMSFPVIYLKWLSAIITDWSHGKLHHIWLLGYRIFLFFY